MRENKPESHADKDASAPTLGQQTVGARTQHQRYGKGQQEAWRPDNLFLRRSSRAWHLTHTGHFPRLCGDRAFLLISCELLMIVIWLSDTFWHACSFASIIWVSL